MYPTSPDIKVHFQIRFRIRTDIESVPIPDRNLKRND